MKHFPFRIVAIVPAGGVGLRAGAGYPKQYRPLLGQPMLRWAVQALLADMRVHEVRVSVAAEDMQAFPALQGLERTLVRPCGGATRAATVLNALQDADLSDDDWVLVHDAARPGLPTQALARLIDSCLRYGTGGLLAEPVSDTVKLADTPHDGREDGLAQVRRSVPREGLWLAQTPQMFPAGLLRKALETAGTDSNITDEASAVERLGYQPLLVPGSPRNFKVTWPEHFELMEKWLK